MVPKHPIPNTSVYLTANIDSRKKRLRKRIESNSQQVTKNDVLILDNPVQFEKRDIGLMELSQTYFNSIVLDTSNISEEETADYIMTLCNPSMKKIT